MKDDQHTISQPLQGLTELQRLLAERTTQRDHEAVAHQQTEQTLQQSEHRFRTAQDISLEAFTILRSIRDAQGQIVDFEWTYANRVAGEILKQPPAALIGQRLLAVLPGNAENRALFDRYVRIVETGQGNEIELHYQSEGIDGWFRNMTVKLDDGVAVSFSDITERKQAEALIRRDKEDLERFVAERTAELAAANRQLQQEIAERKQAEEALRQSQEILYKSQELAHIGVWDWNVGTDTVTWTEELYRIADLDPTRPAPTYAEHAAIFTPESWHTLKTAVERAMDIGEPYQLELELVRPNGHIRYVNAVGGVSYDTNGRVNRLYGIVQDITDRKQADEALRLFKIIADTSQEAIAISDANGQLIYINPAHAQLFGRSFEEAQTLNYRDFYPPESIETLNREVVPALARGESWEGILEVFDRNGRRFPLWERAGAILDAQGQMLYGFGFMHDETARKQAEAALRTAHQELQEKNVQLGDANASKDKFFSIIAHDLRGPFSGLLTFLEIMLDQFDDLSDETLKEYLSKLHLSAKRVYALMENLLTWARLQRGLVEYRPDVIALAQSVGGIVALFAANAEQKSITLTHAVPANHGVG